MKKLSYSDRPDLNTANWLILQYTKMGVFFNMDEIERRVAKLTSEMSQLENEIFSLSRVQFNINSTSQYTDVLIERFGVPEKALTRKGKLTVNQEVLKEVDSVYDVPIIKLVMKYKTLGKQLSSLNGDKGIIKFLIPTDLKSASGDRLGGVVPVISLAETGRYQFSNPSIGNLTPYIMELITAPAGYKIISLDVRQQEPTIFLNGLLNCDHFKKLFKENLDDKYIALTKFCLAQEEVLTKIHQFTDNTVEIIPTDWVYPFLRKDFQTGAIVYYKKRPLIDYNYLNKYVMQHVVNTIVPTVEDRNGYKTALLSGSYGAYETTIKKKAGEKIGASFYRMLNNLPELVEYKDRASQAIKNNINHVYTLFGTEIKISNYDRDGNYRDFNAMLRLFLNYPTQGTGADMLKFAIVDFYNWTKSKGYTPQQARIVTSRHDELLLMVTDEIAERDLEEIKGLMELQVEDWAPILVKALVGDNYIKD